MRNRLRFGFLVMSILLVSCGEREVMTEERQPSPPQEPASSYGIFSWQHRAIEIQRSFRKERIGSLEYQRYLYGDFDFSVDVPAAQRYRAIRKRIQQAQSRGNRLIMRFAFILPYGHYDAAFINAQGEPAIMPHGITDGQTLRLVNPDPTSYPDAADAEYFIDWTAAAAAHQHNANRPAAAQTDLIHRLIAFHRDLKIYLSEQQLLEAVLVVQTGFGFYGEYHCNADGPAYAYARHRAQQDLRIFPNFNIQALLLQQWDTIWHDKWMISLDAASGPSALAPQPLTFSEQGFTADDWQRLHQHGWLHQQLRLGVFNDSFAKDMDDASGVQYRHEALSHLLKHRPQMRRVGGEFGYPGETQWPVVQAWLATRNPALSGAPYLHGHH